MLCRWKHLWVNAKRIGTSPFAMKKNPFNPSLSKALLYKCNTSLTSQLSLKMLHTAPVLCVDKVTINIVDRHRKTHTVKASIDDSILDMVIDNQLDFESYGVCEGTVACSTCHIIFDEEMYDKLEEPLMDEVDMLDLACGLTETSRLGCQIHITKEMDGMTVRLPEDITDARDL